MRRNHAPQALSLSLLGGLLLFALHGPAAAEPLPGAVCSTAEVFTRIGGPENPGSGHFMVCSGGVWMNVIDYLSASGYVGIKQATPAAPLHVNGEAIIGTTGLVCSATIAGAIRYSSGAVQYCNGTSWADVGGGGGSIDGLSDAIGNYTSFNMFLGHEAPALTVGERNTSLGARALDSIVGDVGRGSDNVAIGYEALTSLTYGLGGFVAIGSGALKNQTGARRNTAVGFQAAYSQVTIDDTTAIGYQALYNNGNHRNTCVGMECLYNDTTGADNTAIGRRAGYNITTGSSNIIIGANTGAPSPTGSNQLNIGDTIYGDLSTDSVTIGTTAGQIQALPTGSELIAAGSTITGNACGTVKQITSTGPVTTSTTNTFTAPAAANAGCCMDVVNVGANNITLDANTAFKTIGGADQVLGQYDAVRVCSNGTSWFQIGAVSGNN